MRFHSSEDFTGSKGSISKMVQALHTESDGRRPQFLSVRASPRGLLESLHNMVVTSLRMRDRGRERDTQVVMLSKT